MSGNGFDRWDDQADDRRTGGYDAPAGRRGRRAKPGGDWPGGSEPDYPAGDQGAAPRGQGGEPRSQRPGGRHSSGTSGGYDQAGPAGQAGPGDYGSRSSGGYPVPGYGGRDGYGGQDRYGQDPYRGDDPYRQGGHDGGAYGDGAHRDAYPGQGGYGDQPGYGDGGSYPGSGYSNGASSNGASSNGAYSGNGYSGRPVAGNGYAENGYGGAYRDGQYGDTAYGGSPYGNGADDNSGYAGNGYATDGYSTDAYPGSRYAGDGRDAYDGRDHGSVPGYDTGQPYGGQDPAADPAGGAGRLRARDTSFGGGYDSDAYGPPGVAADGRGAAGYDGAGDNGAGYNGAGYAGGAGYDGASYDGASYDGASYDGAGYRDRRARRAGGQAAGEGQYGWQVPVDEIGLTAHQRGSEDEIDADDARHNTFFRGFGRGDDDFGHRPPKKKKKRRSKAGLVALFVLAIFVAGIAGGGIYAYHWYSARHANYTGAGFGTVMVEVKPGDSAYSLATTLVSDGVVASASAFRAAAENSGKSSMLEPGYFRLHKHMNATLAWDLLINPKARVQSTVTVPDGYRVSKVLAGLAQKTGIPLSQFQSALKNTSALGLPSWAKGNPEGFLWPATYNFQPGASAQDILKTMVAQANSEFSVLKLASGAQRAKLTEYQVIIEASLLEGEVPPKYYGKVAQVIDNRLNQGWRLGLDSTVAYAVNKYIYNLSQSDLNVNSPYNTTKHTGLPPGPIDSPDAAAISAVLHPTSGTWMYFVTVNKSGLTLFTSSSSQFNAWAQEAKNNGV